MGRDCVLVVEDDEHLRDVFVRWLDRAGYETVGAADGLSAIDIARTRRPRVIVMDLTLPVLDGWEAARILKSDATTRDIPVVAVTGQTHKARREDAVSAGCELVLEKPCGVEQFVGAVHALARRRGRPSSG